MAGVVGAGAAVADDMVAVAAAMAEEDGDAVAFALLALSSAGLVARLRFVPPGDLLMMLAVRLDSGAVVLAQQVSANLHNHKRPYTHLATGIAQSTISTSDEDDCELVGFQTQAMVTFNKTTLASLSALAGTQVHMISDFRGNFLNLFEAATDGTPIITQPLGNMPVTANQLVSPPSPVFIDCNEILNESLHDSGSFKL